MGGKRVNENVTVSEAVQMLGVTRQTIYNLIERGRLTPLKSQGIGPNRTYFDRAQVEALRAQGLQPATPRKK